MHAEQRALASFHYYMHVLTHEDWDYLAGDRARIIARARAMAQRLGLDMSDDALYDAVQHNRASLNRVAVSALATNRAFHAQLAGLHYRTVGASFAASGRS